MGFKSFEQLKRQYDLRVRALLSRWRDLCEDEGWTTTDIRRDTETVSTGSQAHRWAFDVAMAQQCRAFVSVRLESEKDATDDGGFVAIVTCTTSVGRPTPGSPLLALGWPHVRERLGDEGAFEAAFVALEALDGVDLVDAIRRRATR